MLSNFELTGDDCDTAKPIVKEKIEVFWPFDNVFYMVTKGNLSLWTEMEVFSHEWKFYELFNIIAE